MKIFYAYNKDFLELLNNFLNSMKDEWELMGSEISQFKQKNQMAGGREADLMRKSILDYAFENTQKDEIFVMSDIDILFYKPCIPIIQDEFSKPQNVMIENKIEKREKDIIFQREFINASINMGFMAMKNNDKVKTFWKNVYEISIPQKKWDQPVVNELLYENIAERHSEYTLYKNNNKEIWDVFPRKIWNFSIQTPDSYMCLHHANCALTIAQKKEQFENVQKIIKDKENEENQYAKKQLQTILESFDEICNAKEYEKLKIDHLKDEQVGDWIFEKDFIECKEQTPAKLGFDKNLDLEFEFSVEFERIKGNQAICLHCKLESQEFSFLIGGFGNQIAGLTLVDQKESNVNLTTFTRKDMIQNQKKYKAKIVVKINSIECFLNEEKIIQIPKLKYKLTCEKQYELNNNLGICSWGNITRFYNIEYQKIETRKDIIKNIIEIPM